jgi:hypothetical protein
VARTTPSWSLSAILLVLAGATLIVTGLYFLFLRPPLLPEDVRYMGLNEMQLAPVSPRLQAWLTYVFRVMGGYILASGVLAVTLAVTSFRMQQWNAWLGALIGGVFSIGWMAVVNVIIDSDFKLVLTAMAMVWAASLVLPLPRQAAGAQDGAVRSLTPTLAGFVRSPFRSAAL